MSWKHKQHFTMNKGLDMSKMVRRGGFTFVELIVAIAILGIATLLFGGIAGLVVWLAFF